MKSFYIKFIIITNIYLIYIVDDDEFDIETRNTKEFW